MIKDKAGKMLITEDDVRARWREHFSELLNREVPENPVEDYPPVEDVMSEPTVEEITKALQSLKNNKAVGSDGLHGELLKYGGDALVVKMLSFIRKIWRDEKMPTEWEEAVVVTLHKKGERTLCDNYRGLSLLNVGYKVLTSIIYRRLFPYYEAAIGHYQAGFLPSKSTIDNIFIVRQLFEKYREYNIDSCHIFVDFAQAYDSIHRDSMWNILRFFSVPEKLVRVLKACYNDTRARVRVGGQLTEEFELNTGLKQGCALSCALFNMALEWVMRRTPSEDDGTNEWHQSRPFGLRRRC